MVSAQDRTQVFDVLVVGGGVNGCGIARDAAGRGLSVYLCEMGDLGSDATAALPAPLHDGLRQLDHRQLRLRRAALTERDRLLAIAPHIVTAKRFVLPHDPRLRAAWRIRASLFLSDVVGGAARLPISIGVDLRAHRYGRPLKPDFPRGFVYSDCWVDDARLALLNAVDAAARGARIATRTTCTQLHRRGDHWAAVMRRHGLEWQVRARLLVNAAGPWASQLRQDALGHPGEPVALVRRSHIVVPRLFQGSQAYAFPGEDQRTVYAIPFQGAFTLIGTTAFPHREGRIPTAASDAECDYLCRAANRYLKRSIGPADIVATFSGVQPCRPEAPPGERSGLPRDHLLDLDPGAADPPAAPLLTIHGGRIMASRRLAEAALDLVAAHFPQAGRPWTDRVPLPGGDLPGGDPEAFTDALILRYPGLDRTFLRRLSSRHGSLTDAVLANAKRPADLGRDFGGGLTECEVDWLYRQELAETSEDILWRRTKAGLFMSDQARRHFADWFERRIAA